MEERVGRRYFSTFSLYFRTKICTLSMLLHAYYCHYFSIIIILLWNWARCSISFACKWKIKQIQSVSCFTVNQPIMQICIELIGSGSRPNDSEFERTEPGSRNGRLKLKWRLNKVRSLSHQKRSWKSERNWVTMPTTNIFVWVGISVSYYNIP